MAHAYGTMIERTDRGHQTTPVTFTTEHAASSYGLPVMLVGVGVTAYGPADVPAGVDIVLRTDTDDADLKAIAAAGFAARRKTDREVETEAVGWLQIKLDAERSGYDW